MAMCTRDQHQEQQIKSEIKRNKLSLESYLSFFRSRDHRSLTCDQLNQIISIHGFKQIKSRKAMEEAVATIKPIDPARSTLTENISSQAFMKLDEVIKDLAALNWQECSITSIRSINSLNYSNPIPAPSTTATMATTQKTKQKLSSTISLGSESGPSASKSLSSDVDQISALPIPQIVLNKNKNRKRKKLPAAI